MGDTTCHGPVAHLPQIERVYDPDRQAMLAALRMVLGLPKKLPDWRST